MSGIRAAVLALATILLAAGCVGRDAFARTQDPLTTWSDRPLAPSADLAARATVADSPCRAGHDGPGIRILVQDRRTETSAAFLVAGATTFGSCLVTSSGGGSGGGSGPAPGAMVGPLTIDADGGGGLGGGEAWMLGGRAAPNAASVRVELPDGRSITASLGNGYWLAWWPGSARARRVVATDGAGAELGSVAVPR